MQQATLFYATRRLESLLATLKWIKDSEFPYNDAESAVEVLIENTSNQLETLNGLSSTIPVGSYYERLIDSTIVSANRGILRTLPYAGTFLRSTNTRNAFEVWGPLRRLARLVLSSDSTKLIYSSGWDYSPYTFIPTWLFENYVIISVPASEASNPFLLPIAGHELGHHIWGSVAFEVTKKRLESELIVYLDQVLQAERPALSIRFQIPETGDLALSSIADNIGFKKARAAIISYARRQIEELFCDVVGVFLFGESFFHAFAYLLAPKITTEGGTPQHYPHLTVRAGNMAGASQAFSRSFSTDSYKYPANYPAYFASETISNKPEFLEERVSRSISGQMIQSLHREFIGFATGSPLAELRPDTAERTRIKGFYFKWMVPAEAPRSLADILNAAWDSHFDDRFFTKPETVAENDHKCNRWRMLSEIMLKSIEMLEYKELTIR